MSSISERDAHVIGAIGRLRFSPLSPVGGRGSHLIDHDGREILDLSASGCPAILGYDHPRIRSAVDGALRSMAGSSLLLYPNDAAVTLAERLIAKGAKTDRRVWFGHSGSDASDTAVRVLAAATGRGRFISFIGSYHGGISGSMAVSGHTSMTHTLPRPGLVLVPYPDTYRGVFPAESILQLLDFHLQTSSPGDQVAGLFMEPLMSDGGLLVPPPGFARAVEERCRRYGIALVLDEVKVGLGRTGLFHAFAHDGVEPDVIIYGKGLGGGLPISAVVGPSDLMDFKAAFALQTMSGNPVAAAAGNAVLDALEEDELVSRAAASGARLRAGLEEIARDFDEVGEVRGRGLALGVDLVASPDDRSPADATFSAKIIYRAYELGAAFIYNGLCANVLELTPPLVIADEEIDRGVSIIRTAIADVLAGKVRDEAVAPFMMW